MLDTANFPSGWIVGACGPDCDRQYQDAQSSRTFYRLGSPGHVIQEVYRLSTTSDAQAKYSLYKNTEFNKSRNLPSTDFIPSPSIDFFSSSADEYEVRCGVEIVPACKAIMRYGQYLVYFYLNLESWLWYGLESNSDGLNVLDVAPILRAADELVTTHLQLSASNFQAANATGTAATYSLPPTPPTSLPELIVALSSDNAEVRIGAAYVLASKPDLAQQAMPELLINLGHSMADVRFAALWAIEAVGNNGQAAIPAVSELLESDPIFNVRNAAAIVLGKIGSETAVPVLAAALYDKDDAVQRNAAEAIATITREDFPTVSDTGSAFDDQGNLVVIMAVRDWWQAEGQYQNWFLP